MPPVSTTINATAPGTYVLEDDGIPGNNFSQIRFPNGTVIVFEHPTGDLNFMPQVAGVDLVVNLTESLGGAAFNVGSLTDPAATPDNILVQTFRSTGAVTLVANQSITEGGDDGPADIVAASVVMSAGTGIGTAANALETQVGALEAETGTGGINLANFGAVSIGGLTPLVGGLDVLTSGNLTFTNFGTIILSDIDGFASVDGGNTSGNVSLAAVGDSDIISNVDFTAVRAPRGDVILQAGRDIALGIVGTNFNNDVLANGNVNLTAGRDLFLDGFADIVSDGFGQNTGGSVFVNVGRDINVIGVAGTSASIFASGSAGGSVFLNTGIDGRLNLSSPQPDGIGSNSGDIFIAADRVLIDPVANMRTFGDNGIFIRPRSDGRAINLGSATDTAPALELSDSELSRLFTSNLIIGDGNTGPVSVSGAIVTLFAPNLTLHSGTDITIQATMSVPATLTLRAGDNIFITPATINVPTFVALADQAGDDGNTGGMINLNALVAATSSTLTGNAEADSLTGTSTGESIFGLGGADVLRGMGGNDSLDGGTGADTMDGGLGDDVFFVDVAGDTVLEAVGEGNDRIFSPISYALVAGSSVDILGTTNQAGSAPINFTGNELAQLILGNAGANTLDSGGGGDTMHGFGGDDFYFTRSVGDRAIETAGNGSDRVFAGASFVLDAGSSVEILGTVDQAALTAINLTGNALQQGIIGNAGANNLDSGGGNDTMQGLGGDDFYFVRAAGDRAVEAAGAGTDRVFAAVSFTLEAGSSIETFSTVNQAATTAINLTGNALAQLIIGNEGANVLDSGGGAADTMVGNGGDDFYMIRTAADRAVEAAAGGTDRIFASVSFTVEAGSSIETLGTVNQAATTALNLTGNALAQLILGNAGANTLDSGGGGDTMHGFGGNDFYFTRSVGDRVVEAAAAGDDRVFAGASFVLDAGSSVEVIGTVDAAALTAINLTGNALQQGIVGNAGANNLDSGGGGDTMIGNGGDDFYFVRAGTDRAVEAVGGGTDRIFAAVSFTLEAGSSIETLGTISQAATTAINLTGNALAQLILGNAGINMLDGGGGGDTMNGFGGNDFYTVRSATDRAVEAVASGTDRVFAAVSFALEAGSSIEVLSTVNQAATTAINLTGNALAQGILGNEGANTLDGGGGGDVMQGFGGNDFYFVRTAADRAVEAAGAGSDRVFSAVSFILEAGSEVEILRTVLDSATDAINLTGNALGQALVGNAGANVLDSGGGADTMIGLGGDDVYIIRVAGDRAAETAGNGTDQIFSTVSFTLEAGSSVETLSTIASGAVTAINLTGNELAQGLIGNAGTNVLDGKSGNDVLTGFGGADAFVFSTAPGAGNVDLVVDFLTALDNIALENAVFTGLAAGALPASAFVTGSAAADANDRIIYNDLTGQLFFDADGSGAGAAVQFATLQGAPTLAASDFIVF